MSKIKSLILLVILLFTKVSIAYESDSFIVERIQPEGLRYISTETFLAYMPIKRGDRFELSKSTDIIRELYKSGFFENVVISRESNNLVVKVVERPIVASVNFSGNKKIATAQLDEAIKKAGFVAGQVLDPSLLMSFEQALTKQYLSLGYQNVKISTKIIAKDQGSVEVKVIVDEGVPVKIKGIKIVGNNQVKTSTLLKEMSSSTTGLMSWYTHNNQFSQEKFDADLEKLRIFYLDRGYLQFKIKSSDVSITQDKKYAYIVIDITEGQVHTVGNVNVTVDLPEQDREQLNKIITIKSGEVFSRRKIMEINQKIGVFLSNIGYGFSSTKPDVKAGNGLNQVDINFVVSLGQKVYLRKLSFVGNSKTSDVGVLRREMRQFEGGVFLNSKLEESTRRLRNLGYIKSAEPEIKPVEGENNQVDVKYNIVEDDSASFGLNVGYSDVDRWIYGASLTDRNFMGNGKSVGFQFNDSSYNQTYSVNYFDPYFTLNNTSLGVNAYAKLTDQTDINYTSSYSNDVTGVTVNHGFPVSEHCRLFFGYGYDNTRIRTTDRSPLEVLDFINQYGSILDLVKIHAGWQYSNLDRYIFPKNGLFQSLTGEASVPVFPRRVDYYKLNYEARAYHPLLKYFVGTARIFLGYGDGYGNETRLPFFENYFAGGLRSVRGYRTSTLGPRDSFGNAIGGNISIYGAVSLVMPNPPWVGDRLRTSLFFDVGNVYQSHDPRYDLDLGQLCYSTGVQVELHSVIPVTVSYGIPINKHPLDREERIQFSIALGL